MSKLLSFLITVVCLFATSLTSAQGTNELKQRTQKYGFEVKNLDQLTCPTEPFGTRPWFTLCVSNSRERNHTVVAWKLPTTKKVDVQLGFGGDMLRAQGETVSWTMNCKSDTSFEDPTGMNGSPVDCQWTSPDPSKPKVYATFFYFVPKPDSNMENLLIFSDFGKGESADETKKRAREFVKAGNLSKL